jgi:hypothetical protein
LFVGVAAEAEMCEAVHEANIVLRVVNFQARPLSDGTYFALVMFYTIASKREPSAGGDVLVELEDETIGLRSRLMRLQLTLRFISEPLAVTLLQGVIADIEARITVVETARRHQLADRAEPPEISN